MAKKKVAWQLVEWYRGCPIEHRPGLLQRGYTSIYHNWYHKGDIGNFIHGSLENARKHIDKLHKDLGDRVAVTEEEYQAFISDD